jgi:SPP1 family predicted phage head-tail adaptor
MRDYRHKIDFLQRITGYDDYGEPIDVWQPFKEGIWASKEPILGNEYFVALTTGTKVEVKFNMRYIPGVTNEMRIQHGEEVYEILSAINVKSLNRELLCYCKLVK